MNEYINLAASRRSWSFFKNTDVPEESKKIILEQANCITPALGDNYCYCVDEINYKMKQKMWHYMHSTYGPVQENHRHEFLNTSMEDAIDPKHEWYNKNICINHHFSAPLVLMFSIPTLMFSIPTTNNIIGIDTLNIQIGLALWHIAMVAQSLGLNSTFIRSFEGENIERTITLTDENNNTYTPWAFICIGYGEIKKDVDPDRKKDFNIVNTLNIDY